MGVLDKLTSERGASIIGPVPKPATKRLRPSVQTSREELNSGIICVYVLV